MTFYEQQQAIIDNEKNTDRRRAAAQKTLDRYHARVMKKAESARSSSYGVEGSKTPPAKLITGGNGVNVSDSGATVSVSLPTDAIAGGAQSTRGGGGSSSPQKGPTEGEWRNMTDCEGNTMDVWTRNFVATP